MIHFLLQDSLMVYSDDSLPSAGFTNGLLRWFTSFCRIHSWFTQIIHFLLQDSLMVYSDDSLPSAGFTHGLLRWFTSYSRIHSWFTQMIHFLLQDSLMVYSDDSLPTAGFTYCLGFTHSNFAWFRYEFHSLPFLQDLLAGYSSLTTTLCAEFTDCFYTPLTTTLCRIQLPYP
jgi:hypothetical protein